MPTELLVFGALFVLCLVAEGAVALFTSGARMEAISKRHVLPSLLVVSVATPLVVLLATRRILLSAIVAVGLAAIFGIVWRRLGRDSDK